MGEKHLNTFKLKKNLSSSEYDTEENQQNKKITSFNLPTKRSYDFSKFAHNLLSNTTNTQDNMTTASNQTKNKNITSTTTNSQSIHPSLASTVNVSSYSNSLNEDTTSIAYTDDEKLMSTNQLNFLDGQMARSFPEFQPSK